jgi:hypothetical protein
VDASTLTPISNARVELLNGPHSPLEGEVLVINRHFEVVPLADAAVLKTDDRGHTKFSHRFFAAGKYGLFGQNAYVETQRVWLRVTGEGCVTTYLAIDQQSPGPRDFHNDTPIWVTVPVAKTTPSQPGQTEQSLAAESR